MGARPQEPQAPGDLAQRLTRVGLALGESLRLRAALFGLELREELQHRKRWWITLTVALVWLHLALVLATVLVAAAFWDSYRLVALGALTGLYLAGGLAALWRCRRLAAARPPLLAATLTELKQDLAGLGWPQ